MMLRCNVCQATQQVSCPDEADEDARTQGIRRTFRAEHQICGERTVSLVLDQEAPLEEVFPPAPWMTEHPDDVQVDAEGCFVRTITRDGQQQAVRVCEDCWRNIPRYVDFPFGLTSPESDGVNGQNAKTRGVNIVDGKRGLEHVRKAVCLNCYLAAFERTYPGAPLPALSSELFGDGTPVPPPTPPDAVFISQPDEVQADVKQEVAQ